MPKTLWDESSRKELIDRLSRLTPDATAKWGKFSVAQMLAHVASQMRMTKGEIMPARMPSAFRYTPFKQLVVFWLPFPKGVPTAPELLTATIADWDSGIAEVRAYIEEFATYDSSTEWPVHPLFGRMTPRAWGVLGYRHTDHHFRQFGI
jgi:hypothetical protein